MTDRNREDIELLAGRRGPEGKRAVRLEELQALAKRVETTVKGINTLVAQQKIPQVREAINQINRDIYTAKTFVMEELTQASAILRGEYQDADTAINAAVLTEIVERESADQALAGDISIVMANLNAAEASITAISGAVATLNSYAAATYALRAKAGGAVGELELVAASDPINGDVSSFRVSADQILLDGSVYARMMSIDELLVIDDETGGFSLGKTSANDFLSDGMYIGRTALAGGGTGFGFLSGRIRTDGLQEYIQHTDETGLKIANANFLIEGGAGTMVTSTSNTSYSLPPGTQKVSFQLCGGGAGGNGYNNQIQFRQGSPGGASKVKIYDGATLIQEWTASGGTPSASPSWNGQDLPGFGAGGAAGISDAKVSDTPPARGVNGQNATGNGAGGGSSSTRAPGTGTGGTPTNGGGAAQAVTTSDFDVSGLSDPNVVIEVGAAGLGNGGGGADESRGGNGAPGIVRLTTYQYDLQPAGVISREVTAQGTIVFPSGTSPFPDIAPNRGLWWISGGSGSGIEIAPGKTLTAAASTTFVTNQRPVLTTSGSTSVSYAFWAMA
ncbi:hypothetical protein [Sagittula salina]|uniref:Glycine-rich domain-containing protein n=1 Tax=Sagittula salina TaxID=2820268 RepID=A0A940MSN1_9RHOB|nr:hypothetical protein [Sagittula salina]MBP0484674.1 hypothetical protein [Sagittula salina]